MKPEAPEAEQPFLAYDGAKQEDNNLNITTEQYCVQDYVRDSVIVIITSLIWLAVIYWAFLPRTATANLSSLSRSSSSGEYAKGVNVTWNHHYIDCGSSVEDATRAGCTFTTFMNGWFPPVCTSPKWEAEFRADGSYHAYRYSNLTGPMTPEETGLMVYGKNYYTAVREHVFHCTLIWKKQFYSLYQQDDGLDSLIASPEHTEHCIHVLNALVDPVTSRPTDILGNYTFNGVIFGGCWVRK